MSVLQFKIISRKQDYEDLSKRIRRVWLSKPTTTGNYHRHGYGGYLGSGYPPDHFGGIQHTNESGHQSCRLPPDIPRNQTGDGGRCSVLERSTWTDIGDLRGW